MSNESASLIIEPLAIVGMDCLLPGANGLDAFWNLLSTGSDAIGPLPEERFNRRLFFESEKDFRGKSYSDIGGVVPSREIDLKNLNILESEASNWDECHLLLADVARVACQDARLTPQSLANQTVGVYVGHSGGSSQPGELTYAAHAEMLTSLLMDCGSIPDQSQRFRDVISQRLVETMQSDRPLRLPGGKPYLQANSAARLIAESLGLVGPQMTIDAACASSLAALAMAATALQQGEIDTAIVGGASYNKSDSMILFSNAHSCSATGTRPFDDQADGLVSSEGYVAMVIKTLAKAEKDGDQIWGVLRGMGMASDGRGKSLWAPRQEGQLTAIKRAYSQQMHPSQIQYVEAHATSTKVGDATEARTLTEFYGSISCKQPRRLGSVKSNIGHTLETAGLAGLVKTMLSMQKKQIPPVANLRTPSSEIDWKKLPFEIPINQPVAWENNQPHPRCAAINAFGIGGLNVHLVVEQFEFDYHSRLLEENSWQSPTHISTPMVKSPSREPIAIVGRGIIAPGAYDLATFANLLENPDSQICLPSKSRWPTQSFALRKLAAHNIESLSAGYVNDYEYDWRKHKIPPKQVAQGNTLQFMFLDAAQQALDELQPNGSNQLDQNRTAVVVGTIFGGEFGHQLHLGLRFRQIVEEFRETLKPTGISKEALDECIAEFETKFFELNSALLDETGSFTSSTLASRITKQFNLMGGALAIDSGDCSGLASIDASMQLLRQHACDAVVFATGQRSMDLVSFEEFAQRGELTPDNVPAEGAVSLLLMRQSDAEESGHKIYGFLDDVENHFTSTAPARAAAMAIEKIRVSENTNLTIEPSSRLQIKTKKRNVLSKILPSGNARPATLQHQIGNLGAAHAALSIVAATLRNADSKTENLASVESSLLHRLLKKSGYSAPPITATGKRSDAIAIQSEDHSGLAYALLFQRDSKQSNLNQPTKEPLVHSQKKHVGQNNEPSDSESHPEPAVEPSATRLQTTQATLARSAPNPYGAPKSPLSSNDSAPSSAAKMVNSIKLHSMIATALSAETVSQLISKIESVKFGSIDLPDSGALDAPYQCVIVSQDEQEFLKQRSLVCNASNENGLHRLSRNSIFVRTPELITKRPIAILFPGQGSQDASVFDQWSTTSDASENVVKQLNSWLHSKNQPSVQQIAMQSKIPTDGRVNQSISSWPIQVSMIASNAMLMANLKSSWLESAICAGHSLGEFSALQYANSIELPDLLNLIAARATAVDATIEHTSSGLLSLAADAQKVQSLLGEIKGQLFITHCNSPMQTIVGGQLSEIRLLESECKRRKIDSRALAVSAAFHTPLMNTAAEQFRSALSQTHFSPTDKAILSGVGNKFICDPIELRRALCEQLTSPLNYVGLVRRLYKSDCRVFIECGPGNVLSNLNNSILGDSPALLWSISGKNQTPSRALAELAALEFLFSNPRTTGSSSLHTVTEDSDPQSHTAAKDTAITHANDVDTLASVVQPTSSQTADQKGVFDATQRRRDRRRAIANQTVTHSARHSRAASPSSLSKSNDSPGTNAAPDNTNSAKTQLNPSTKLTIGSSGTVCHETLATPNSSATPKPPVTENVELQTPKLARSVSRHEIEGFINEYLVEQTGYSADMLEPDWDLEADLGIDSIKQAQLFGELRDTFEINVEFDQMSSDSTRTIRQITDKIFQLTSQTDVLDTQRISLSETNDIRPSIDPVELRQLTMDFIMEHTGYPEEMISEDAEFEADLGLDSIKLAQLFGELRSHYPESINSHDHSALSNVRTFSDVIELFGSHSQARENKCDSSPISLAEPVISLAKTETRHPNGLRIDTTTESAPKLQALRVAIDSAASRLQYLNELDEYDSDDDDGVGSQIQTRYALPQSVMESPSESLNQAIVESVAAAVPMLPESLASICCADDRLYQTVAEFAGVSATPQLGDSNPETGSTATSESTRRFVLRTEPTDLIAPASEDVKLIGACLVIGNNDVAENIENRLSDSGHRVLRVDITEPLDKIKRRIDELWQDEPALNLFIASALDAEATIGPNQRFNPDRTQTGTRGLYWICQHWYSRVIEADRIGDVAIVGFGSLGGDLGFTRSSESVESGMVAGLIKALHIETWVAGHRGLPIKHIDCNAKMSGKQIADAAWYELTNHTHEIETGWIDGRRHAVRAISRPLAGQTTENQNVVLPSGNWICTGGARGITARAACAIGTNYDVTLHLVGKTELVEIEDDWLTSDPSQMRSVKRSVMHAARDAGENPMQRWKSIEKTIEIRSTLAELSSQGITAHYYCSNLADPLSVQQVVEEIVSAHGPITGCLHGAGSGEDARFEKKNRAIVEPCLDTKITGTLALIEALEEQPLKHFIGFGSISGRFGANGQTDYSSANEMLAKITGWLRQYRPEVLATTFLWHAWGDVGMATKAENKLALEIIGMQFMPSDEGVLHMLREIEAGLPEREILITDNLYRELFFPSEEIASLVTHESDSKSSTDLRRELRFEVNLTRLAILDNGKQIERTSNSSIHEISLDPEREIFLREHTLENRPLLPIVVGVEMLVESAVKQLDLPSWFQNRSGIVLENLIATRGLKFFNTKPTTVRLHSRKTLQGSQVKLTADFYSRNGQLMQTDRKHMSASIQTLNNKRILDWPMPRVSLTNWRKVKYPSKDQMFNVGPAFQVLRSIAVDNRRALGQLRVPALVELAGTKRHCEGWQTPSAILDGCLFATGVLNWEQIRKGVSLPVGIEQLAIHRMPSLGTQLTLDTRFVRQDETHCWFDFCLWDNLGNLILEAKNYQTAWIK